MKLLVTGGAGFIGSNFVRHILNKYDYEVVNLDCLTYCGNLNNLRDVEQNPKYKFVLGNIADVQLVNKLFEIEKFDMVVNFAAESHVDRSINDSQIFIKTNVLGTHTLLEAAKNNNVQRFLQIGTDEVYGFLNDNDPKFTEETPLTPSSPYSASKTSSDLLALAFHHTYGLNVVVTRCSNNYGQYQYPEKLISLLTTNAIEGKKLPVYGKGLNVRDWIHVEDHCKGVDLVLHKGRVGEVYNLGGDSEKRNIEIVDLIVKYTGIPKSQIEYVPDRLGHDWRYAIDFTKINKELGWKPEVDFEQGIKDTIEWYKNNDWWWKPLKK